MTNSPEGPSAINRAAIEELTTRAVSAIYPSPEELVQELESGRRMRAYMGIDPTAPDMHVGHESQLLKLRRLQDLGHEVILLIGDFTAMIGDPSDKSAARVKLSREEVLENAQGYKDQASKILDFDHPDNPVQLRYNSEWLGTMDFGDVLELASEFTVQQMLERSMFRKRMEDQRPLGLHELMYPMMQGYDSVAMDVDIEVGGSDQIFNMLVGTTLIKRMRDKQKYVIAGKLLEDPSGRKIGKTEGNMITLNDTPDDMFHKVMLWGDEITPHALELCSAMPMAEVHEIDRKLRDGTLSGIDGKRLLARTIVSDLHGPDAAAAAETHYQNLTAENAVDTSKLQQHAVTAGESIITIMREAGLAASNSEARRLLEGRAVRVNGETIDLDWQVPTGDGQLVLQVGKKKLENHRLLVAEQ